MAVATEFVGTEGLDFLARWAGVQSELEEASKEIQRILTRQAGTQAGGRPSSSASVCTLGRGDLEEHWNGYACRRGCAHKQASIERPSWCRRLFVMQWGAVDLPVEASKWAQRATNSLAGYRGRVGGHRVWQPGQEETGLTVSTTQGAWWYRVVVYLERECELENAEDLLYGLAEGAGQHKDLVQPNIWCASCCDECRRGEMGGWLLSMLAVTQDREHLGECGDQLLAAMWTEEIVSDSVE